MDLSAENNGEADSIPGEIQFFPSVVLPVATRKHGQVGPSSPCWHRQQCLLLAYAGKIGMRLQSLRAKKML